MWSPVRARPRESHACTFTAQKHGLIQVHHFCCCLVTQSWPTFWDPHGLQHTRASLSFTISQSLLKLISTESMMPCSHLISSSLPSPPAFNLSQHQDLFQWVSSYIKGPKYWSFSFSISPSNEYSGLISFRIDWFELHHYIISIIIIYIRIARFSKDFDTLHSSHTSRTSYLLFISMLKVRRLEFRKVKWFDYNNTISKRKILDLSLCLPNLILASRCLVWWTQKLI